MTSHRILALARVAAPVLALALWGCGDDGVGVDDRIAGGVDLDALFAPATSAEVAAVSSDWAGRTPDAVGVSVELDTILSVLALEVRVRVVSHLVDGAVRHFGAVITPTSLMGPAPVIVYAHGGASGVGLDQVLFTVPGLGERADEFVWVVPSFRSEPLTFGVRSWTSEGTGSPWDRDVDDAIALLDAAFEVEAQADSTRIGVLGFSRGAGVGLLMGIRDDRIDRIVEFFGPSDFFGPFVQEIVEEALNGSPRELPGMDDLDRDVLQPLANGQLDIANARLELVRRSSVLFADRLPAVQIHHGTADAVVSVSQAEALISALEADGRTEPDVQAFLYEDGTHNPLALIGALERTREFLIALLDFDFVTGRAQGNCDGGGFDMTVPPADTAIIRAWIQNGAPNN